MDFAIFDSSMKYKKMQQIKVHKVFQALVLPIIYLDVDLRWRGARRNQL